MTIATDAQAASGRYLTDLGSCGILEKLSPHDQARVQSLFASRETGERTTLLRAAWDAAVAASVAAATGAGDQAGAITAVGALDGVYPETW